MAEVGVFGGNRSHNLRGLTTSTPPPHVKRCQDISSAPPGAEADDQGAVGLVLHRLRWVKQELARVRRRLRRELPDDLERLFLKHAEGTRGIVGQREIRVGSRIARLGFRAVRCSDIANERKSRARAFSLQATR